MSILAEVIAARHGRSGGRLSRQAATVHTIKERGQV